MQTISEIRALLAARGIRPKKRFGQNFLHDKNQLTKLVEAAEIETDDVVLEVGPGTGTLTEALLDRGAMVVACEIDHDLAALLRDHLIDRWPKQLTLLEHDCLERNRRLNPDVMKAIDRRPFKLVANLPYQAATPLIAALLLDHPECTGMYITIQREVADRLLAEPSTKAYGPLTVIVQTFADIERIAILKPTSFWPQPKVTSAMVRIIPAERQPDVDRHRFARFVTQLFTKRRKQLGTIFGRDRDWPENIMPDRRPDSLSPNEILHLFEYAGDQLSP